VNENINSPKGKVMRRNLLCCVLFLFTRQNFAQTASPPEIYFPTDAGTTSVYKISPDFLPNTRERYTITRDSVSTLDSSHFLFVNGGTRPKYRVDTLLNVYLDPLGTTKYDNQLIFKQKANKFEAWALSDSIISGAKRVARIREIGNDFLFGRVVKYKQVEWGEACEQCLPDSFGLSPKSEYYAVGFGLYLVIIEPPQTERVLVGFITGKDTLGDITRVINLNNLEMSFLLYQNFPNPFNPTTTFEYNVPRAAHVTLTVYDLLGREVRRIVDEFQIAGTHRRTADFSSLSSGVYCYKLAVEGRAQTHSMILLK
jgi:hypothetical protein